MKKEIEIAVSPEVDFNENYLPIILNSLGIKKHELTHFVILKKSIDARSRNITVRIKLEVYINEKTLEEKISLENFKQVHAAQPVIIVGAGPAGLFAALELIENGYKPIIVERGKNISERSYDIAKLNREHIVNPHSNYCFGEGGAGTFSDGKLYTRSTKRGDVNKILNLFIAHGAEKNISFDAHPHIGTDCLPNIIKDIRKTIINFGGEIHFSTCMKNLIISGKQAKGIISSTNEKIEGIAVILATGHSARDVYSMLHENKIKIAAKPFALGVRVEHPQEIIDKIQYKSTRGNYLPPASYTLVSQADGRGVFSFCMCPGGIMVPAATAVEEIVINGMSNSKRNSKFANSGIVVQVDINDFLPYKNQGALAGIAYQQAIEHSAWKAGGKNQTAPAQRLTDFIKNKTSLNLPVCSYFPGVESVNINEVLPQQISSHLKIAFQQFNNKMKGYITEEAIILGVESRTSSPVQIIRDIETLEHIEIENLYPCGEGAGYAGGIVSSAIDGQRCALKIVKKFNKK